MSSLPSQPEAQRKVVTPWKRVRGDAQRIAQTGCALLAMILVVVGVAAPLAAAPALITYYMIGQRHAVRLLKRQRRNSVGAEHPARILLGLIPLALYSRLPDHEPIGWITVALLALLPVFEPHLAKVLRGRRLRCVNLPGVEVRNDTLIPINSILIVDLLATLITTIVLLAEVPISLFLILPLAALALMTIAALDALQRVRGSVNVDNELYTAVAAYQPKFILYYGVGTGSEYQVSMWIGYLERIGEPFIVVLRHVSTFAKISAMTDAPVIVRTSMRQLDDVVVPSVTTAFYVNNGALNAHLVRYPQITHVQLLHGDSDKATSFNPITAMFDKIFVAGQAGIDRYADNGIDIPAHKFEIVGRPQVEAVQERTEANIPVRSVLYAPTWEGHFADTNYSSVSIAPDMIRALVQRGQRVVFRPHPYSYRNDQSRRRIAEIHEILGQHEAAEHRGHLWGEAAETELGVFDCFNSVDAMISDVSSVVPDFLYSGKPFAIVAMSSSPEQFAREFPLARAGYVIERDLSNLEAVLDDLLVHDSKEQDRQSARVHYLGPFEAAHYADGFINAAREVVTGSGRQSGAARQARVDDEELSGSRAPVDGEEVSDGLTSAADTADTDA